MTESSIDGQSVGSAPPLTPGPRRRALLWASVSAIGGLILGIGGTLGVQAGIGALASVVMDARLSEAVATCEAQGISLEDQGRTLVIESKGKEDLSGASIEDIACVLTALDTPTRIISHIDQTTSMDGRQTESWDGLTVQWSYHPDRGADMVIAVDNDR